MTSTELFEEHRAILEGALNAVKTRGAWTPFQESPSRKHHPEGAHDAGRERFESLLGKPFDLRIPGEFGRIGNEISPYTGEPLGIDYPCIAVDILFNAMEMAAYPWADSSVEARVGVCLEILDRLSNDVFANAYATMHTAGQAFMMAFAGSGANSLDRGLEALTYAYKAMKDVPERATYTRSFGGEPVTLEKRYRLMPRGIAVVVTCGSYPAWNAYPAIFANLATGNPVVVKPHPNGILPIAMAVKIAREVLLEVGFDPNLVTLAADEQDDPVTKELVERYDTAIIDFTGSQSFGDWLVENCRHAQVYTETAGCNAVVVDSTHDLDGMLHAIAQSLALFSAQMCTAAQNIFVPRTGIETDQGRISPDEFVRRLVETLDGMLANPKHAAAICGAAQTANLEKTLDGIADTVGWDSVIREHAHYDHPEFPNARTLTPLLVRVDAGAEIYRQEHFGPVGFIIECDDRDHALRRATGDAVACGSIASYAYSSDPEFIEKIETAFAINGASVGINLIRQLPINFTAAYSDYHVTGLNPAGNACLTDLAFVANRFRIVQSKVEIHESE